MSSCESSHYLKQDHNARVRTLFFLGYGLFGSLENEGKY